MKRLSTTIGIAALIILSTILIGCTGKQLPDECYKTKVEALYLCEDGQKIITYSDRPSFDLITIDGQKTVCSDKKTEPCNIFADYDYCERLNYCELPKK
ncbi:hypothetical protein ACFL0V_01515 [Nanoarchaeota archaeon]